MKKYRFSLFIDEKKKPIIMIDADIIMECLFKNEKSEWVGGYALALGNKYTEIAPFSKWSKAKEMTISNKENGFNYHFDKDEVIKMKKAIMERDKRIKLEL